VRSDFDKAIATLRPLITFPSWITPAELISDRLQAPSEVTLDSRRSLRPRLDGPGPAGTLL